MAASNPAAALHNEEGSEDENLLASFAAVIENRAREVGVAVLDIAALRLELSQFVEPGRLYTTTLLHLTTKAPRQVVVVDSAHYEVAGKGGGCMAAAAAGQQTVLVRRGVPEAACSRPKHLRETEHLHRS
jgi:hypothetical protein